MRKHILLILLLSFHTSAYSYEPEDYIEVLQWESKWNKVVSGAMQGYLHRGIEDYPSTFDENQRAEATQRIKAALNQKIGWTAMKDKIVRDYRRECGDELLGVFMDFYSGAEFSDEEKEIYAAEYQMCATRTIQSTGGELIKIMEKFVAEKEEILASISKDDF